MSKSQPRLAMLPPAPRGRYYSSYARTIQRAARKRADARIKSKLKLAAQINKNSLALKRLKVKDAGGVFQRNFQRAKFVATNVYKLEPTQPIAFALNDFTSSLANDITGGQIFGASYSGTAPNILTSSVIVGNWNTVNPAQNFGLAQQFRQWSDSNQSTVSPVQYMPLSASYSLTFQRPTLVAQQGPLKLRIDVIQTKRRYVKSQYHDYTMPECLGAFQRMACSQATGQENAYNPDLWKVRTKYITLPAVDTGTAVVRVDQSRTHRMFEKFPKKNIKLHLDEVSATQKEPFHLAVDPRIIKWCVISISDTQQVGVADLQTRFQRTIRYRDLDNKPL